MTNVELTKSDDINDIASRYKTEIREVSRKGLFVYK